MSRRARNCVNSAVLEGDLSTKVSKSAQTSCLIVVYEEEVARGDLVGSCTIDHRLPEFCKNAETAPDLRIWYPREKEVRREPQSLCFLQGQKMKHRSREKATNAPNCKGMQSCGVCWLSKCFMLLMFHVVTIVYSWFMNIYRVLRIGILWTIL